MSIVSANRRTVPEIPDVQAVSDGPCIRIPRTAFSLNGFRQWVLSDEFPEKLRVTYVDGEIYLDMSKEELQTHAFVKAEIARVLMNLNRESKQGRFCLDGVLISNEAAGVSNNPDAVFIKWETLEKGRAKLTPRGGKQGQFMEIEGSPDWVLEIVSDSSVKKDTTKLRSAYHRAGIFEYWLVDARGSEINFQVLQWRKKGYLTSSVKEGWQASRLFQCEFRLAREISRMGLWEYTLATRKLQPAK
jgi:Uma2 family endonuclease